MVSFLTIVFDGYDLIVYGATLPSLLAEPGWDLGPAQAGAIGSYALIGMVVGALGAGAVTSRFGHRRVLLAGITWFAVGMLLSAAAPDPTLLGLLRFLTGVGLGAVIPSTLALTVEYAPRGRRQLYNILVLSGYSFGGVLASILALVLLADHGWRLMFALGAAPLVIVLPLVWRVMPESVAHLRSVGRHDEADRLATRYGIEEEPPAAPTEKVGLRGLFAARWILTTVLFGAVSFCGLLLVYGLNTWLPQIMRQAGYPLGSALTFLLVLNIGAIVGSLCASLVADRVGSKPVILALFGVAALALLALSFELNTALLMSAVVLAGIGSVGTQSLINGYVAAHHPPHLRGAALGWALGVGRVGGILGPLFGGWVLASGWGFQWNFYGFLIPAVLGAVFIALVPRPGAPASEHTAQPRESGRQ